MKVELQINNSVSALARFVTWAPSPCRIRVTDPSGTTATAVTVQLSSVSTATAGAVTFRQGTTGTFANTLSLAVPVNGTSVPFFIAGKFGQPSTTNGDVKIEARVKFSASTPPTLVGSTTLMVRVRKSTESMTTAERDRFVNAFGKLNNQGQGRFQDFRDMHATSAALAQAHGAAGFLPWHRAYLLDLERELQAIDPSVTLPYWRFDQAAPKLFTRDFFGVSDQNGRVQFSNTNPLQFWKTDGFLGINRSPFFSTSQAPPGLFNENQTFTLGGQNNLYRLFRRMEGNPHGSAHVSFGGFIHDPPTAPKDPLFFLLHCNVDRLWAKWQLQNGRFDRTVAAAYDSNPPNGNQIGHNLADTMWPWNGVTVPPRPPTAPGGTLAASDCTSAPGPQPQVQDCLDYHGVINPLARMGFDYDDVRFA